MRKFLEGPWLLEFTIARASSLKNKAPTWPIWAHRRPSSQSILNNAECYMGDKMQQLKTHLENLQQQVRPILMAEVQKRKANLQKCENAFVNPLNLLNLPKSSKNDFLRFLRRVLPCWRQKLIAAVRDTVRRFEEVQYPELLSQLTALTQTAPVKAPQPPTGTSQETPAPTPQPEPVKPWSLFPAAPEHNL